MTGYELKVEKCIKVVFQIKYEEFIYGNAENNTDKNEPRLSEGTDVSSGLKPSLLAIVVSRTKGLVYNKKINLTSRRKMKTNFERVDSQKKVNLALFIQR